MGVHKQIKNQKGFTLIEAILVIAIMAIIVGIMAPLVMRISETKDIKSTREEMELILKAIIGDPTLGIYGYLGDMGRLPRYNSLKDLNFRADQPPYYIASNGVGIGWNGPYVMSGLSIEDYLIDAWGTPYIYDSKTGIIRSCGPNKIDEKGRGDDICIPPFPMDISGDLIVHVFELDKKGAWIESKDAYVKVFYSKEGKEAYLYRRAAPYIFRSLHLGLHAIKAEKKRKVIWKNVYIGKGAISVDLYLS